MVNISWNKILKLKEEDQNFLPQDSNANYTVFYSLRKEDYESMQSVCYLVHNTNRELGHTNSTSLNAVFCLYKKYKSTRKRLDYEMQDVRNMANTSKSDEQISEIQNQNKINKYATLTEENNASKI